MPILREYALLPVTAISSDSLWSELLLIGEGPFVRVFSLSQASLLSSIQVFESQAVHGITLSQHQRNYSEGVYVVWGGRSICFLWLSISGEENGSPVALERFYVSAEHLQNDWVLDAKFIQSKTEAMSEVIYLDAHNNLHRITNSKTLAGWTTPALTLLAKGPPCALYCGHIKVKSEGLILIASGTVFGAVLLWTASIDGSESNALYYSGHEGSVFGIQLFEIQISEITISLIVSCSDDRTIKIWNVPDDNEAWEPTTHTIEAGTGFSRHNDRAKLNLPLCSGTAHLSRIWRVMVGIADSGHTRLISLGEDATAQIWEIRGETQRLELVKLQVLNLHAGKNIWAGAVISRNSSFRVETLVTGGADGRISMVNLNGLEILSMKQADQGDRNTATFDIQRSIEGINDMPNEAFRNYCCLESNQLLAISSPDILSSM